MDWENAPVNDDDPDALERWLMSRMAHLSAEQGSDDDDDVDEYPRRPANAERHWTRILVDKDIHTQYRDDARVIDLGLYFDVPNGFRLDRQSAPKLVAQDPAAAVNLLRALHHARLPLGRNMGLWVTTDAFTEICRPLAPGIWRRISAEGVLDYFEEVVRAETFLGENVSWVISILQQVSFALEYCATQRQLGIIGWRGDDLGMTARLSCIVSTLCTNASKNQRAFFRIVTPDGMEVHDALAPRLTQRLRERMGSLLVEYIAMYMPTGPHDEDDWLEIMQKPAYVDVHKMMLRSWFFNEEDAPFVVQSLLISASIYISTSGMSSHQLREYGRTEIFAIYGPSFLERLSMSIVRPELLDDTLSHVLSFTARSLTIPEYHPHFLRLGTLKALRKAVDRQAISGRDDDGLQCSCLQHVLDISLTVILDVQSDKRCVSLLHDLDILCLLARAIPLSLRGESPDLATKQVKILSERIHRLLGQVGEDARGETLVQDVRRVWFPTLRIVTPLVNSSIPGSSTLVKAWRTLGQAVGLDEDDEKVHPVRMCAWRRCQYHTVKPPAPTRKCQGCGEACYCSRECQIRDWKEGGHKARCRRLKDVDATGMPAV